MDDAYLCLFPLGFLGLHHFYLRRPGWGVLYLCTFGVLGIGWVIDWFRLPCLVNDHNKLINSEQRPIITTTTTEVVGPGLVNPSMVTPSGGVQPPAYHQQGYPPQAYPGQMLYPPQGGTAPMPPSYGTQGGVESWSTIASSDVGHESEGVSYCPPSYQEATAPGSHGKDESAQNTANDNAIPPSK